MSALPVCSNSADIKSLTTAYVCFINADYKSTLNHLQMHLSRTGAVFLQNLGDQNKHIGLIWPDIYEESISSKFVFLVPLTYAIYTLLCYMCRHGNLTKPGLVCVEIVAIGSSFIPLLYPWQSARFFLGLTTFMHLLVVHSIVCEKLQTKLKGTTSEANLVETEKNSVSISNKSLRSVAASESLGSTKTLAVTGSTTKSCTIGRADSNTQERNSFFKNVVYAFYESCLCIRNLQLHQPTDTPTLSLRRLGYFAYVGLISDSCIYLIREVIPLHIRSENRLFASTLVGGLWVLASMDFAYSYLILLSSVIGKPLPYVYRHRHPFLSSSLAEFWGVRWNPLIGKALQDSFYKPVRRLGGSRGVAMVMCFLGSAYLHAHPQYLSTQNVKDLLMMGGFFVAQGILVPIETLIVKKAGLESYFKKYLLPKAGGEYTSARYQWLVELFTIVSILSTAYAVLECDSSVFSLSFYRTTFGLCWGLTVCVTILSYALFQYSILLQLNEESRHLNINSSNSKQPPAPPRSEFGENHSEFEGPLTQLQLFGVVFCKLLGWIWTVAWILYLLPNFTLPTLHALLDLYPRSFVVGAIVKSVAMASY